MTKTSLIPFTLALTMMGCSSSPQGFSVSGVLGSSSEKNSSAAERGTAGEVSNQPPAETKPSEESEGAPGYPVNPNDLVFQPNQEAGTSRVSGPVGSVSAGKGDVSKVLVSVWLVDAANIDNFLKTKNTKSEVPAKLQKKMNPNSDGAFDAQFTSAAGAGLLVVSLAPIKNVDLITLQGPIEGKTVTAVKNPTSAAPFQDVIQYHSENQTHDVDDHHRGEREND